MKKIELGIKKNLEYFNYNPLGDVLRIRNIFSLMIFLLLTNSSCVSFKEAMLNPKEQIKANIPNLRLVIDSINIEKVMKYNRWDQKYFRFESQRNFLSQYGSNYIYEEKIILNKKWKLYDQISEANTPFATTSYRKNNSNLRIHRITLNSPPTYNSLPGNWYGLLNKTKFINYPELSFHTNPPEIQIIPEIPFAKGEELLNNMNTNPNFFNWWNKDGSLYNYVDSVQKTLPNFKHYYIIGFKDYYDNTALDIETQIYNYFVNNIIESQGSGKGTIEISIRKNYHKINKGLFILSSCTLYTINLLGFPALSQKASITVNARIKNSNGDTIKEYSEEGIGKAYSALYWGYSFSNALLETGWGLPRVAHTLAISDALKKIKLDLIGDSKEITKSLDK